MNRLFLDIEPMGAVRTTGRQKFKDKYAQRYFTYKQTIKLLTKTAGFETIPAGEPITVEEIVFYMPIPQSWSKKKQREAAGQPHIKKPDIDNLIKGLFDSLNGVCWADDNQVCEIRNTKKIYSEKPGIEFSIETRGRCVGQAEAKEETKQTAKRKGKTRTRGNLGTRL